MFNRIFLILLIVSLAMFLFACDKKTTDPEESTIDLKINEIFSTGSPDWLEIYNPGLEDIIITGFHIYDAGSADSQYVLPEYTVPAGGFLVLLCDDEGVDFHTNFKLSSGGEEVSLEDDQSNIIDNVDFPELSDGTSYGRNPDGGDTWQIYEAPTQGTSNTGQPANTAPEISTVVRSVQSPTPADSVTITATVTDDYGLDSVLVYYDTSGISFTELVMSSIGSDQFEATIPSMPDSTQINYYVRAIDDSGLVAYSPEGAPDSAYYYISLASAYVTPLLYINEFLASNDATNQDPDFTTFSDWLEIYNDDTVTVDLAGMYLTDNLVDPTQWQIPAGTTIPAGGFLLIWADNEDTSLIDLHTNFKLGGGGEQVGLYSAVIFNNIVIDSLTYLGQTADISYGRQPDGSSNWQTFTVPTPEASNNP